MNVEKNKMNRWVLTVLAIILIAVYRLMPHPWNFAPVTASALFGGMVLTRRLAWIIPIATMLISDAIIGISWPDLPFVYGSLLMAVAIGIWIGPPQGKWLHFTGKTITGTLAASVLFYLITNFGSWLILPMYPKTFSGLWMSYTNAIPFFQNSLAGDLFFVTVFTAVYYAAGKLLNSLALISGKP